MALFCSSFKSAGTKQAQIMTVENRKSEEKEVGVSVEAGRRKGEALDLLRIQEDDENPRPKSGLRMDFREKKKIEAAIGVRERKWGAYLDIRHFMKSELFVYFST